MGVNDIKGHANESGDSVRTRAAIIDPSNRRRIEIKENALVNQLARDSALIAESFDAICFNDLNEISGEFAATYGLVMTGIIASGQSQDSLRLACAELLSNALNTVAASTSLLRTGYTLQPGILIRSCLEAVSVALHLIQNDNDLDRYKANTLESTRTIASAKRVLPPFGRIYHFYSTEFVHIGKLHKSITKISPYKEKDEILISNLGFIRFAIWLVYVSLELIFFDSIAAHRFWVQEGPGYRFAPSDEEKQKMNAFFGALDAP